MRHRRIPFPHCSAHLHESSSTSSSSPWGCSPTLTSTHGRLFAHRRAVSGEERERLVCMPGPLTGPLALTNSFDPFYVCSCVTRGPHSPNARCIGTRPRQRYPTPPGSVPRPRYQHTEDCSSVGTSGEERERLVCMTGLSHSLTCSHEFICSLLRVCVRHRRTPFPRCSVHRHEASSTLSDSS